MTIKELLKGKKAALIDMDGVLYDSMRNHAKAWRKTMLDLGVDCPEDEFFLYEGMTGPATINLILRRERNIELPPEDCKEIYSHKAQYFRDLGEVNVMPGAQQMIKLLTDYGLKLVLVTGSAQSSLLSRLESDYPGAFPADRRVTALDVANGKPHPEPYLKGLQKAGVTADEAVVIENAPLGVRAGNAAGVQTIAVTTGPIPAEAFIAEGADIIFSSMPEFAGALQNLRS